MLYIPINLETKEFFVESNLFSEQRYTGCIRCKDAKFKLLTCDLTNDK